jgi:hypothetical protein
MNSVQVLSGQSLSDIAIHYTGDLRNAYAIAFANAKSLTDALTVGEFLNIPDDIFIKSKVYEIVPANGLSVYEEDLLVTNLGIGIMIIEETFIVT